MNIQQLNTIIDELDRAGWSISRKTTPSLSLNLAISARYPNIPEDYVMFLENVISCINPDQTAWFLVEDDYNGTSDSAFAWNEFENQSLEAAEDDTELIDNIKHFWDQHMPIMLSVKSGYAYLAITVSERNHGSIVYGGEPEYEDSEKITDSFQELLNELLTTIRDPSRTSILKDFI